MDRAVVVTGGGTGIGRAAAARFAADGDSVFVLGRRREPLEEAAAEIGATAVVCDATDPEAIEAALAELPERIDVLVNNAGGNRDFDAPEPKSLAALLEQWRANFEANVLSAVAVTTALEERLAPGGAVVLLGSIAADKPAESYGAAKAALASWCISLAKRLGPREITANVVSPGYIGETEFFRDTLAPARRDFLIGQTVTGSPGTPGDVAAAIHFLASPGARHITGQTLHVNGGALTTR